MGVFVIVCGALLMAGGGFSLLMGFDIVMTERGSAMTIGGVIALSAGVVATGIGFALRRLGQILAVLEARAPKLPRAATGDRPVVPTVAPIAPNELAVERPIATTAPAISAAAVAAVSAAVASREFDGPAARTPAFQGSTDAPFPLGRIDHPDVPAPADTSGIERERDLQTEPVHTEPVHTEPVHGVVPENDAGMSAADNRLAGEPLGSGFSVAGPSLVANADAAASSALPKDLQDDLSRALSDTIPQVSDGDFADRLLDVLDRPSADAPWPRSGSTAVATAPPVGMSTLDFGERRWTIGDERMAEPAQSADEPNHANSVQPELENGDLEDDDRDPVEQPSDAAVSVDHSPTGTLGDDAAPEAANQAISDDEDGLAIAAGEVRDDVAADAGQSPEREPVEPILPETVARNNGLTVLGTYNVGGRVYSMFSDGSVEAVTEAGVQRFRSMEELRQHLASA